MKSSTSTSSYDDRVRAQYAGIEARRRLDGLTPANRSYVVGFQKSGLKPTDRNCIRWLALHGITGAVGGITKLMRANQKDAEDALVV